jgi:hypothetical protein
VAEARAGEVLINHLHLGLLAFLGQPAACQIDQRLAKRNRKRDGEAGLRHPNIVDEIKGLDALRQSA